MCHSATENQGYKSLELYTVCDFKVLEQSLIGIHPQIPYKSLLLFLSGITTIEQLQQQAKQQGI